MNWMADFFRPNTQRIFTSLAGTKILNNDQPRLVILA